MTGSFESELSIAEPKLIAVILGDHRFPDPVKRDGQFNDEDFKTIDVLKDALRQLQEFDFVFLDNHRTLIEDLKAIKSDVWLVVNLCDEGLFNNPQQEKAIPLILEELGLPYTGAGAECMEQCYDKVGVSKLAQLRGVPFPKTYQSWEEICYYPVIIKPRRGDGGMGIFAQNVVYNGAELLRSLKFLREEVHYSDEVIFQEFLTGQDLTCGIIGPEVLPIIEEDYSCLPPNLPPIQGWEAKWLPDSPYWQVKSRLANIPASTRNIVASYSKLMFTALCCQDYARFDWRLDAKGFPRILEVNPNPGWCWDGHLAKIWNLTSRKYSQMLNAIILSAAARYQLQ